MADEPTLIEGQVAHFNAQLAQLRLIAYQAEEALEELARQMRGSANTPEARRSDEVAAAMLARVSRRKSAAPP